MRQCCPRRLPACACFYVYVYQSAYVSQPPVCACVYASAYVSEPPVLAAGVGRREEYDVHGEDAVGAGASGAALRATWHSPSGPTAVVLKRFVEGVSPDGRPEDEVAVRAPWHAAAGPTRPTLPSPPPGLHE